MNDVLTIRVSCINDSRYVYITGVCLGDQYPRHMKGQWTKRSVAGDRKGIQAKDVIN